MTPDLDAIRKRAESKAWTDVDGDRDALLDYTEALVRMLREAGEEIASPLGGPRTRLLCQRIDALLPKGPSD